MGRQFATQFWGYCVHFRAHNPKIEHPHKILLLKGKEALWSVKCSDSASQMISLRNIEKFFPHGPSKSFVLRRVNLEIREGEFLSIMGPSGAGKSTLLHLIGMHDSDWTGEYHLLDHAVHTLNKRDRSELSKRHFGFGFQSYHLLDNLTVYENREIPLSYRNYKRAERESIVGKKDLYPNQLSGGQQQLVGVARAMIASPKVILADEPTGNLHSNQGREVMELFRKLNDEGTTIIQVTHSETNAAYGHRTIPIEDGWISSETKNR